MTILYSARRVTLAGGHCRRPSRRVPRPIPRFRQDRAVANGLGTGIAPPAAVSSLTAHAGLVVIPLLAAWAASALTLVYRDHDGQRNAVEDFVEVLRSTGVDRVSRNAPIALRVSR
jgi:DNA-binding transcriptional LysR family regulator